LPASTHKWAASATSDAETVTVAPAGSITTIATLATRAASTIVKPSRSPATAPTRASLRPIASPSAVVKHQAIRTASRRGGSRTAACNLRTELTLRLIDHATNKPGERAESAFGAISRRGSSQQP
jgi:hypothetical protein